MVWRQGNLARRVPNTPPGNGGLGSLVFVTINGSAWSSIKALLDNCRASVVLVQEHKLHSSTEVAEAQAWCLANGWMGIFGLSDLGPKGKPAGGTGVLLRQNQDMGFELPALELTSRLTAVVVNIPGWQHVLVCSIYMQVGSGLGSTNFGVLGQLGGALERHKGPLVCAGDFNMGPSVLEACGFIQRAGLMLANPKAPTCVTKSSRTILDYYLVSSSVGAACSLPTVDCSTFLSPHRPVYLELPGCLADVVVQVLSKPQRLPLVVPFGPRHMVVDCSGPLAAVEKAFSIVCSTINEVEQDAALTSAYTVVANSMEYQLARTLGVELTSTGGRPRAPRLISTSLAAMAKKDRASWRSFARHAAWLFNRTKELGIILRDPHHQGHACKADELELFVEDTTSSIPEDPSGIMDWDEHWHLWTSTAAAFVIDFRSGACVEDRNSAAMGLLLQKMEDFRDAELLKDARDSTSKWKQWAADALAGGASRAHKWSKVPQEWAPVQHRNGQDRVSSRTSEVLVAEKHRLEKLWDAVEVAPPNFGWQGTQHLGAISVQEIRAAALSFPTKTCSTWDGFHPRQFGYLSDDMLEVVIVLLYSIEARRAFPQALRGMVSALVLKLKGLKSSHRVLAIFPGLYRLWARLRRRLLRTWETSHQSAIFAWQKGSSCVEVVYRQSLVAEFNRGSSRISAAFLWDLSDFYEHLDRAKLRAEALANDFPGLLLTVALNQYQGYRVLVLGQQAVFAQRSRRGIPAGCTFATYEVQCYTLRHYSNFQARHKEVSLTVFIDDLFCMADDTSKAAVVNKTVLAADDLLEVIVHDLSCNVSLAKSAVVASDCDTLNLLRKRFGIYAGPAVRSAGNLGIDFACGSKARLINKTSIRFKRMAMAKARKRRLLRLRSTHHRTTKVFTAGVLPAIAYGSGVVGMTNGQLRDAQSVFLAASAPGVVSRSRSLSLLILNDPCWRAAGLPILHWAQEVWGSMLQGPRIGRWCSLSLLSKAFAAVACDPPRGWGDVVGPIGALWLTLPRFGWAMTEAFRWKDEAGVVHAFTEVSPAAIKRMLAQAWRRKLEVEAASKFPGVERLWAGHAAKLLRPKRGLTAVQKGCLESFLCRSLWTKQRAIQCGYIVDDGDCALCGAAADTVRHRLLECPALGIERAKLLSARDAQLLDALPDSHPVWSGFVAHPALGQPRPLCGLPGAGVKFWCKDPTCSILDAFKGELFTDGSLVRALDVPELARSGWAVVCMRDGLLFAVLSGPVWDSFHQSSPVAEAVGFSACCQVVSGESCLSVDYSGVVNACNQPQSIACSRGNVLAGPLRAGFSQPGWPLIKKVDKIKAHQDLASVPVEDPEHDRIIGNAAADEHANVGRMAHPPLIKKALLEAEEQIRQASVVCSLAAELLPAWPPIPRSKQRRSGAPAASSGERGMASEPVAQHCWRFRGQRWRCEKCLVGAKRKPGAALTKAAGCAGFSAPLREVLAPSLGHKLHCFEHNDGSFVIGCSNCGGWAASNPRSLRAPCAGGFPNRGARSTWARLARGVHPSSQRSLDVVLSSGVHVPPEVF